MAKHIGRTEVGRPLQGVYGVRIRVNSVFPVSGKKRL